MFAGFPHFRCSSCRRISSNLLNLSGQCDHQAGSSLMSQSILPINVPAISHVGQISRTRRRCCYGRFYIIRCWTWCSVFPASCLFCCALATWSDESRVAADRGRGALSQPLKPFEGFLIRYCSAPSTQVWIVDCSWCFRKPCAYWGHETVMKAAQSRVFG